MGDDREPLAQLDPTGKPTVLSYNVPEPTSYSGKSYIDLSQLPPDAFTIVAKPFTEPVAAARPLSAGEALIRLSHPALTISASRGDADGHAPMVESAYEPVTRQLAELRGGELANAVSAGLQPVIVRNSAQLLDIKFVGSGGTGSVQQNTEHSDVKGEGGGSDPETWILALAVQSPELNGPPLRGPAGGISVTVVGTWHLVNVVGLPKILLTLDGPAGGTSVSATVSSGSGGATGQWQATITITSSGSHSLFVEGTLGTKLEASTARRVEVDLDAGGGGTASLPFVQVTTPRDKAVVVAPTGVGTILFQGSASASTAGESVSVDVVDVLTSTTGTAVVDGNGAWSAEFELAGQGRHDLTVTARRDGVVSPPVTLQVTVSLVPTTQRLLNRLMIVETLALSAFLGEYGAGRALRTFSLLPGEHTTISINTFTQSDQTRKDTASVLDSAATEVSHDFDTAVSREQTNKDAEEEASNYKVGAEASATWGWGSAKISASFSGSANSAREQAVKNVDTATQKHTAKASSNRSVTVNTDYEVKTEDHVEESTTREISNINVSRTLNFVFRQLNQEHFVLFHLTDARVAFYAEDLLLDSTGKPVVDGSGKLTIIPTYREVSLPELPSLLNDVITDLWREQVTKAVVGVLSGIPDYNDELRTVVEEAKPKDGSGNEVPGAAYLRFPRNLTTDWKDPAGTATFTVPGIVLSYDKITMRTDGVIVDALLGQGDALDDYSHGLQDQSVASRRIANDQAAAAVERERLAQKIVADKDGDAAGVFAQVFPPPAVQPCRTRDDKPST